MWVGGSLFITEPDYLIRVSFIRVKVTILLSEQVTVLKLSPLILLYTYSYAVYYFHKFIKCRDGENLHDIIIMTKFR